jgi:hypothetical protein
MDEYMKHKNLKNLRDIKMSKLENELGSQNLKEKAAKEFRKAAKDTERNSEIEIWDTLIGDGIDEINDYKTRVS